VTLGYRDAGPEDASALVEMATRSFIETFGSLYTAEGLATFIDRAFGPRGLPSYIGRPDHPTRLVLDGEAIVAYARLAPGDVPSPPAPPAAIMLKQFYILSAWQGAGIAPVLMDWVLATARARRASHLVLSVYADNHRAKRFYARYGFVEIGTRSFDLPAYRPDDDRIWSLRL
jgi:ribosomal protein S18 acetylase RimI-like enzyme